MTERLKKNSNIHIYINVYIYPHTYTHIYYNYIQDNTNIWAASLRRDQRLGNKDKQGYVI